MKTITFEQLLTDPKYREMTKQQVCELIFSDAMPMKEFDKLILLLPTRIDFRQDVYNHLQKLKAESEKKAEPIYGESPIISHINAIQMGALIEKVAKEFNKPVRLETLTKEEHPIQITDQKAREICAKHFNCIPNEIKILHP